MNVGDVVILWYAHQFLYRPATLGIYLLLQNLLSAFQVTHQILWERNWSQMMQLSADLIYLLINFFPFVCDSIWDTKQFMELVPEHLSP